MSAQKKLDKVQQAIQSPADAVVNTASTLAPAIVRPSASKHPSWVGPKPAERPTTPGAVKMQYPITIDFYLPGTQPPVYIATDLSKPQWRPVEMDSIQDEDGEYKYSMTFEAETGEYQYKLRLGPGDWWICDDSVPKVTDDDGNENNLAVVKEPQRQDSVHHKPPTPLSTTDQAHHLTHKHSKQDLHRIDGQSPLFSHESLVPPLNDMTTADEGGNNEEPESPPLLRHESIAPSSYEQEHSPLFRHESTAIDYQQHNDTTSNQTSSRLGSRRHSHDSIPQEADPNDPSLEKFPTDHEGIFEHLDRARRSMSADETSESNGSQRRHSSAGSNMAEASPSLPSVKEDDDEEEGASEQRSSKPALYTKAPRVMILEPHDTQFAPITPPMTPDEGQGPREHSQARATTPEEQSHAASSVHAKVERLKKKAQHHAKEAAHSSLPAIGVGLAIAMAAASAAVAVWYIKTKNDNVLL